MSLSPLSSDYWDAAGGPLSLFDGALQSFNLLESCDIHDSLLPLSCNSVNHEHSGSSITIQDSNKNLNKHKFSEDIDLLAGETWLNNVSNVECIDNEPTSTLQLKEQLESLPDGIIGISASVESDLDIGSLDALLSSQSPTDPTSPFNGFASPSSENLLDCCFSDYQDSISDLQVSPCLDHENIGVTEQDLLHCLNSINCDTFDNNVDIDINLISENELVLGNSDSDENFSNMKSPITPTLPLNTPSVSTCPVSTIENSELKNLLVSPISLPITSGSKDLVCPTKSFKPTMKHQKSSSRYNAYNKPDKSKVVLDKKERKKLQNKEAAIRYRRKKRMEDKESEQIYEALETRNTELKNKVEDLSREINYLKNLFMEIYQKK